MPYASNAKLPASVRDAVPSGNGQDIMRNVINSQLAAGKSEEVAFASAWAALKRAGYVKDGAQWIKKRALSDDAFTLPEEARDRSVQLGLGGEIHVEDQEGQAVYMPGASHEAYMARMAEIGGAAMEEEEPEQEEDGDMLERGIRAIVSALTQKRAGIVAETVLKIDEEQRIVWGWASVISEDGRTVTDTQGDQISPDDLMKAANRFMMDARVAKAMHEGEQVGEVIHSLPLTNELAKALGIVSKREGWIVAMRVNDDAVWKRVKSGELKAFSIGGKGKRNAV